MILVSGACGIQQLEAGPRSLSALKRVQQRDKDCEAGKAFIRSDIHVKESTGGLRVFRPIGVA